MNDIDQAFAEARDENARREAETIRIEKRIASARAKLERNRPITAIDMAQRLVEALQACMPDRDVELLGPFGLAAEMGIHVKAEGHVVSSMTIVPGEGASLKVVDPDSESPYPSGTLGARHGLGRRSETLTGTVDELVAKLRRQEDERRRAGPRPDPLLQRKI